MAANHSPELLIDVIAGARPNFMKIAPILRALRGREASGRPFRCRLVHTGQHYDARMSGEFFTQLGIREPDVNLEVGSGTQAEQTAAIMVRYEKVLLEAPSHLCLVVGDVTSTMACAITARKQRIRVAHVEAGIRSGDWTMPEEVNRVVTDSVSDLFFTTSEVANANLRSAGARLEQIHFVGNTMIDTLLAQMPNLRPPAFWDAAGLEPGRYFVLTLHRPSNVDDADGFVRLVATICDAVRGLTVVFPVHPRTGRSLAAMTDRPANLLVVEPQPYLEFNHLVKLAKGVITDSGGVTEETTVMGVPCITMRDSTERPETVTVGTNVLIGTDPVALQPELERLFAGQWKKGAIPERWDGQAGQRIADVLSRLLPL